MLRYIKNYKDDFYIFKVALQIEHHMMLMEDGFNHVYKYEKSIRLYTYNGYIVLNVDASFFDVYSEFDVLSINEKGIIEELYVAKSLNNAMCVTLQCNSNCIMCPCSEMSRRYSTIADISYLKEVINYYPKDIKYLTITGGEPTLLGDDFIELIRMLKINLNNTTFQVLTNGRAFSNKRFSESFNKHRPRFIQLGIPLYGYDCKTHDSVTQADGSFKQTIQGINNLLSNKNNVEIRVVLTKVTIINLKKIAELIIDKIKNVDSVKIMGLEMLGNAVVNKYKVWEPYDSLFDKSREAIDLLISEGVDVAIYNLPLCMVKKDYWGICEKSISDYKVEYNKECSYCKVKDLCGGIFQSTRRITSFKCKPVL